MMFLLSVIVIPLSIQASPPKIQRLSIFGHFDHSSRAISAISRFPEAFRESICTKTSRFRPRSAQVHEHPQSRPLSIYSKYLQWEFHDFPVFVTFSTHESKEISIFFGASEIFSRMNVPPYLVPSIAWPTLEMEIVRKMPRHLKTILY